MSLPIILGDLDPTLPVSLSSFAATLTSDLQVLIAWVAESETDHAGYNLLRSEVQELLTAVRINNTMIDQGNASGTQMSYLYSDTEVYRNARYYYWLESVSLAGHSDYYGPISVLVNANGEEPGIPSIPLETLLFSAFPNPFNPSTNLRYSLKEAGDVRIDIFNLKGQILKSFENVYQQPGYYQIAWDGRDADGREVGAGIYFYRMTSGKYSATKKMVMAK
ncbi:MAG: T9SS type A sorting domain-containing protein [Candidatus Cloacimonetes bacterium]|nr:T9SS type A sorting domain-containing protein [Candidatus Cloacimonadota bacterium]